MSTSMPRSSSFRPLWSIGIVLLCLAGVFVQPHLVSADAGPDSPANVSTAPVAAHADWDENDDADDNRDTHERSEEDSDPTRRFHTSRGRHFGRHHHGDNVVNIGHDSSLPAGQRADSVVSVLGSSSTEGDAADVVSVLGNTRVSGAVSENAVAVLGNTYIDSKIGGDAIAVLGNVELGPNADVGGDVIVVGGTLVRDPAAIVHGNSQSVFAASPGGHPWMHAWVEHCLFLGRPLSLHPGLEWAWVLALLFLALYVGLALVFRTGLTRCAETFETQPGHSVLAALISMLLVPVLIVLLFITFVGIAALPFVLGTLFCAGLFGKAVMLAWVGRRMTGNRRDGVLSHPAIAVLIGGVIVLALYLVPVLGFILYKLLGFLGLGAVVYTLVLTIRSRQPLQRNGVPPSPPGDASSPAAAAPNASSAPFASSDTPDAKAAAAAAAATARVEAAAAAGGPPPSPPPPSPNPSSAYSPAAPAHSSASAAVLATYPRAGFWVRMAALLLDILLVGFVTSVLHSVFHLHLVLLAAYGAIMWKMRGTTVGGIVFDLQVVRQNGREMDWETAIIRALSCFLSLIVAGLGFFWIAFDGNRQAWHDKIAGTVVVRLPKGGRYAANRP